MEFCPQRIPHRFVHTEGIPVEDLVHVVEEDGSYGVSIYRKPGSQARLLKIRSSHDLVSNYASISGSITVPADAEGSLSVGAIPVSIYDSPSIETFSSQGPTLDDRIKPDISGPDKAFSYSYDGEFPGTSAAAPHVAGAAALLMSANPTHYTAQETRDALFEAAADLGEPGKDNVYGYGKLRLSGFQISVSQPSQRITTQELDFDQVEPFEPEAKSVALSNAGTNHLAFFVAPPLDPAVFVSYQPPTAAILRDFEAAYDTIGITATNAWAFQEGRIHLTGRTGELHRIEVPGEFSGDIDVSADVEWIEGAQNSEFGLLLQGTQGHYRLSVTESGSAKLLKYDGTQLISLTEWQRDSSLVLNAQNNIRLLRVKNQLLTFFNGQPGPYAWDEQFETDAVSLTVGGAQRVAFDNVRTVSGILDGPNVIPADGSQRFYLTYLPESTSASSAIAWFETNDPNLRRWQIVMNGVLSGERPSETVGPSVPSADFDGDGRVGFSDFLIFAQGFGVSSSNTTFDARLDLDRSGRVGFEDFLLFAQAFGT